jgi:hypothetical protein
MPRIRTQLAIHAPPEGYWRHHPILNKPRTARRETSGRGVPSDSK